MNPVQGEAYTALFKKNKNLTGSSHQYLLKVDMSDLFWICRWYIFRTVISERLLKPFLKTSGPTMTWPSLDALQRHNDMHLFLRNLWSWPARLLSCAHTLREKSSIIQTETLLSQNQHTEDIWKNMGTFLSTVSYYSTSTGTLSCMATWVGVVLNSFIHVALPSSWDLTIVTAFVTITLWQSFLFCSVCVPLGVVFPFNIFCHCKTRNCK